jgi:hypothetical protein
MPRKSVKKIMKELMAKKKLTAKEKKLLMKMQKGGRTWWEFLSGKPADTAVAVDQATLTKQFDDLKGQICNVCKAAYGEDGCKCGNTAPPSPSPSPSPSSPEQPEPEAQTLNTPASELTTDNENNYDQQELTDEERQRQQGGRRKSGKRKNKRSRKTSKKMKW